LGIISTINHNNILDIGVGRGKYGFLIREYFSDVNKLDGIDIFEKYITDIHKNIYDNMLIGNALDMEIGNYDVHLLIDIIEHWDKEETHNLISRLLKNGNVIIATPNRFIQQGAYMGNEWERHKTFWSLDDFKRYSFKDFSNDVSNIILITKNDLDKTN